mmetsp:Transcript_18555/g.20703  ORF Transcript_18555/g.20703 Transcript_18555/m.20703 type:complete len:115 (+) Transcript_18555:43-387(+)|eukprot:CAMPEP_0205822632 /NCGR_PEP_ID=MMETSP0206-20130828/13360_1 /ASSEMBLY_ACC=CAM_ASM_000279 /TAXON_ID=36767 /ORGANISM="Euplotes focardii, Strain TN1" /LENGTH=114 /DNA_ID=CAMNT_0053119073 /DNA_START=43 /DNA_END=387 /DNA_ORIENTATION=+
MSGELPKLAAKGVQRCPRKGIFGTLLAIVPSVYGVRTFLQRTDYWKEETLEKPAGWKTPVYAWPPELGKAPYRVEGEDALAENAELVAKVKAARLAWIAKTDEALKKQAEAVSN